MLAKAFVLSVRRDVNDQDQYVRKERGACKWAAEAGLLTSSGPAVSRCLEFPMGLQSPPYPIRPLNDGNSHFCTTRGFCSQRPLPPLREEGGEAYL